MHNPLSHWPTKRGMLGDLVDLDQLRSAPGQSLHFGCVPITSGLLATSDMARTAITDAMGHKLNYLGLLRNGRDHNKPMHAAPAKATFVNDCGATAPRVNPNTRKAAAA